MGIGSKYRQKYENFLVSINLIHLITTAPRPWCILSPIMSLVIDDSIPHAFHYLIDGIMRFDVVGGDDVVSLDGDVSIFGHGVHGPQQLRYEFEAGESDAADESGAASHLDRASRRHAVGPSRH